MSEPIHRREVVLLESPEDVKVDVHQVMNPLHPDVYNSLKESIWAEGILVPLLLDKNYAVIDGHNRIQCWKDLLAVGVEIGKVPAVVYDAATKYDAYRIAVTTNSVRRDPSALKPELVRKQLLWLDHMYEAAGDPPDDRRSWTDARIASTIGIQHDAVRDIRAKMEQSGEIATATRRVGVQLRSGKRVEVTSNVERMREAAQKGIQNPTTAARRSSDQSPTTPPAPLEPAKIKMGRKEMTPEEVREEVKRLKNEKKQLELAKKGAEQAEKNIQASINARIEEAKETFDREIAAIRAKHGDSDSLEFMEIPDEAFLELFREAESVRLKDAAKLIQDLFNGFPERMIEFMPGEAAQAALKMHQASKVIEALRFMSGWLGNVADEMEDVDSLAVQRHKEGGIV